MPKKAKCGKQSGSSSDIWQVFTLDMLLLSHCLMLCAFVHARVRSLAA